MSLPERPTLDENRMNPADERSTQLPWEQLWRADERIPWAALNLFADAVVGDSSLTEELCAAFEEGSRIAEREACFMHLYVVAIFALAAQRLSDEQRRRIAEFLIGKLVEAGRQWDDLMGETLEAACGTIGPAILPAVLDAIERESDAKGAWFSLWNLTQLAAHTDDADIREPVVQACVRLLEKADQGEVDQDLGINAAWTLGLLGRTEHLDLLQRLSETGGPFSGGGDYREAVRLLKGCSELGGQELWERPVRDWFEPRWKWAREWFEERSRPVPQMEATPPESAASQTTEPREAFTPPIPIVNHSPKVGRNDPCPCGSGKKFKKCCGRSADNHAISL